MNMTTIFMQPIWKLVLIKEHIPTKRATCENYIKESKYDVNIGTMLLNSFWANEAIFQIQMLVYNLFLMFKQEHLSEN